MGLTMTTSPALTEAAITRAEIERLRAACRCAFAALSQNQMYPADVALALRVLGEAIGAPIEEVSQAVARARMEP